MHSATTLFYRTLHRFVTYKARVRYWQAQIKREHSVSPCPLTTEVTALSLAHTQVLDNYQEFVRQTLNGYLYDLRVYAGGNKQAFLRSCIAFLQEELVREMERCTAAFSQKGKAETALEGRLAALAEGALSQLQEKTAMLYAPTVDALWKA